MTRLISEQQITPPMSKGTGLFGRSIQMGAPCTAGAQQVAGLLGGLFGFSQPLSALLSPSAPPPLP